MSTVHIPHFPHACFYTYTTPVRPIPLKLFSLFLFCSLSLLAVLVAIIVVHFVVVSPFKVQVWGVKLCWGVLHNSLHFVCKHKATQTFSNILSIFCDCLSAEIINSMRERENELDNLL